MDLLDAAGVMQRHLDECQCLLVYESLTDLPEFATLKGSIPNLYLALQPLDQLNLSPVNATANLGAHLSRLASWGYVAGLHSRRLP